MYVHVSPTLAVTLAAAEDFRSFKLVVDAAEDALASVAAALAGIAVIEDAGRAWVSQHWLRSAGPQPDDPSWQDGLTGMIGYARRFGWVDDAAGTVRAHIEWTAGGR